MRRFPEQRSPRAGFSMIEVLVSLAVMVVVLGGLLAILQVNSRIAKAQVNLSEMQQALRVVQADLVGQTRMAGRGGLPRWRPAAGAYAGMPLPEGPAVTVENGLTGEELVAGNAQTKIVDGSDVLTVRGVFNTPVYQVNPAQDGDVRGAKAAREGSVVVRDVSPTGVPQDLGPLAALADDFRPEALLLVSAGSDEVQAVVELDSVVDNGNSFTLNFNTTGGNATEYMKLSPGGQFPEGLRTVAMVGILEEYRYYARDVEPAPRLSRARVYPGTDEEYAGNAANLHVDIADNVLDLQVALGIDRNGDQVVVDNGDDADEWLFNAPGDSPPDPAVWNGPGMGLYYVRITSLARTDRIDPDHLSPPIQALEDHEYNEPATPGMDDRLDRSYRRRVLETVVDLRNL